MAYQLIMIRCLNFSSAYLLAKNMVLYYFTISGLVLNMILLISKHVSSIYVSLGVNKDDVIGGHLDLLSNML